MVIVTAVKQKTRYRSKYSETDDFRTFLIEILAITTPLEYIKFERN
jgi:hypothetical protein